MSVDICRKLLLYNPSATTGVAIPYPTISLHAIQRLKVPGSSEANDVQGLYMQLSTGNSVEDAEEDLEEDAISMTIVPQLPATPRQDAGDDETLLADDKPSDTPTELLFSALSECSNLHPDLNAGEEGEDEEGGQQIGDSVLFQSGLIMAGNNAGGLPPALPGSGGWITAENMHEYFDEDGNWIGEDQGSLGPGAGSVRPREDGEEGQGHEDGSGQGTEETKWRRTD